jgi:hypothetical protein
METTITINKHIFCASQSWPECNKNNAVIRKLNRGNARCIDHFFIEYDHRRGFKRLDIPANPGAHIFTLSFSTPFSTAPTSFSLLFFRKRIDSLSVWRMVDLAEKTTITPSAYFSNSLVSA